jgi:hypothetical protein
MEIMGRIQELKEKIESLEGELHITKLAYFDTVVASEELTYKQKYDLLWSDLDIGKDVNAEYLFREEFNKTLPNQWVKQLVNDQINYFVAYKDRHQVIMFDDIIQNIEWEFKSLLKGENNNFFTRSKKETIPLPIVKSEADIDALMSPIYEALVSTNLKGYVLDWQY